jgi:hypothetical protein
MSDRAVGVVVEMEEIAVLTCRYWLREARQELVEGRNGREVFPAG